MTNPTQALEEGDMASRDHAQAVSAALERAAQICEAQAREFLSPEYAVGQPLSSFAERFACTECARAIRAEAALSSAKQVERDSSRDTKNLHQDEAQRREGACFECGAELHAPFCPACNPEMVRPSPSWPSKEEIAGVIARHLTGDFAGAFLATEEWARIEACTTAILALFPAPTQDKTP